MGMQYDVKAVQKTGDGGAVYADKTRVKAITISYEEGGTVVLKDGGVSGTTRFSFTAPAVKGSIHILTPGEGILFSTDVYAALTSSTIVVFYG